MRARASFGAGKFRVASATCVLLAFMAVPAHADDPLPVVFDDCQLSQTVFNSWFQSGTAAPNGFVNPANSITFNPMNDCDFYKWSEQMWLWATSPTPAQYGGNGRVFMSSIFYNVSPIDPRNNNMRTLRSNFNPVVFATSTLPQVGREGLPTFMNTKGVSFQVITARQAVDGNSMIRNDAGRYVEIGSIQVEKGKVTFYNRSNKKIEATVRPYYELLPPTVTGPIEALVAAEGKTNGTGKQSFRAELIDKLMSDIAQKPVVERFTINNRVSFVTTRGTIAIPEVGQAVTNGVLLTTVTGTLPPPFPHQNQLVVYNIDVNDVYAYYVTGRKRTSPPQLIPSYNNSPDTVSFPTTQAGLDAIQSAFSTTFTDGIALTVELKSSWVDASLLSDPQDYILRSVAVPTYTVSSANHWQPTGHSQTKQMALTGLHLVGSTAGHPEMIWASYEHVNNSPHGAFYWNNQQGPEQLTLANTGPSTPPWTFYDPNSGVCPGADMTSTCNAQNASVLPATGEIVGNPIAPTNVMRTMAFGAVTNQMPALGVTPATSDDEVIAINNHVQAMLPGDVRSNYVFIGATWTANGAVSTGRLVSNSPIATLNNPIGNEVGTSALSNSTMETFVQGPIAKELTTQNPEGNPGPSNCLGCHINKDATATINTTDVSHIFDTINPLF